ncbi:MAG: TonB-dependent receptor [Rhodocyclaceae bacterium]|nr:TonB-dependent receptor [Rhodocyclaceae bacterium]MDP3032201.1 TonB-dependent receptor [Rhodocyclaceae bacterium]
MTKHPPPFATKRLAFLVSTVFALASSTASLAAPVAASNMDSVLNLSLEELMQATVTSASKKSQSLAEIAGAVFVIKADDIRRSGATNVPEALRLAPGVQVAAISQNKWSVSIRGFNSRFSNKLLVMVDGRAIYSAGFSGVFWEHNDIPLNNIERIEVIRGPGGSIWGANAVNGIINIITYSAKDTQGGLISAAAGNELRGVGQARYGWALDEETHLRLHAQTKSVDAGQDAVTGGKAWDNWKNQQAGFRLDATRGGDNYSLQGALSDYRANDRITAFTAAAPYVAHLNTDGAGQTGHLLGRWEHPTDNGSRSLQAFIDHNENDMGVIRYRIDTFDLEYQQQIIGDKHDLVWGLGYRSSKDRIDTTPHILFSDTGKSFSLYSAFIQDDITLVPNRWRLTLGARLEHNAFTGVEMQPNIRLLWTPTAQDSLWAAVSRAVRTPSRGERASTVFIAPPPPLPFATVGDPNMTAEKLTALDLGWRRQWSATLTSDVAAFYYRHADLRGGLPPGPTTVPLLYNGLYPYLPVAMTNTIGAESYGLEVAVDWLPAPNWRLQGNTSLFHINPRDPLPGATGSEFSDTTPGHQVSLRSSLDITPKLQWDVWLRRVGKIITGSFMTTVTPAYTSLDMRLAWKAGRDLEISLVGQNLLDSSHPEIVMAEILSAPVKIERGVYLKADWQF